MCTILIILIFIVYFLLYINFFHLYLIFQQTFILSVDGTEHDGNTNSSAFTTDKSHDSEKLKENTRENETTPSERMSSNTEDVAFNPTDPWGSIFDNNF